MWRGILKLATLPWEKARSSSRVRLAPGFSTTQATGPRTSPFDPPPESDIQFVVDSAPGDLDTGCTFRGGGPLEFDVEIARWVGPVDTLAKELEGTGPEVYTVGDCVQPGNAAQATFGAARLALKI